MLRMAISAGAGWPGLAAWAAGLGRLAAPVDFVLVREKRLAAGELVCACRAVRQAAVGPQTKVLVAGGRLDVALAAGLDGVHLGGGRKELQVAEMRRLMPEAVVSVSCHTLDEVRQARDDGASLVLFAPVFSKQVDGVEVVPGIGLEALRQACLVPGGVPVLALGGVSEANAAACVRAGAAGIAGIGMFAAGSFLGQAER